MSTIYIKLSNGDDLVAHLQGEDKDCIRVINPVAIRTSIMGTRFITGFFPWVPITQLMNGIFTFTKNNVLCMTPAPEEVETKYKLVVNQLQIIGDMGGDESEDYTYEDEDDLEEDHDAFIPVANSISRTIH